MLKVGELAALANLTVRTLHHYDSIGLLCPSARSDAGYRLYARDDVARLQQIQALRAMGMSLADIGLALDDPANSQMALVDRQLEALDERIQEATRMRGQLLHLRRQLANGDTPDLSTWLTTLEMTMDIMNVYEQYFTQDELERMPVYTNPASMAQWQDLLEQAVGLMQSQVPPHAPAANAFAQRWLHAFEHDMGGDGALMVRANAMAAREQDAIGLPAPVMEYVFAAAGALREATWRKHVRPEVVERMRRHHAARGHEWHPLIERVHAQSKADPEAAAPASRALAGEWLALFRDMVGTDPADIEAFRRATMQEPVLRMGSGIDNAMLDWLRRAMPQPA
jgi:DNA-binding transcriptional MerR regulator